MPSRRQHKLDTVIAGLQLRYGPAAVCRAGTPAQPAPHLSTTFAALDAALGIGGLPRGRLSEIVGPVTSGKVTLAAKVLAAAHRDRDAVTAWLDLGRTCDPDYLQRCGLDLDRLLVVHPSGGADALAILCQLVESRALAALVFDGLADLGADVGPEPGPAPALSREHDALLSGTLQRLATTVTRTETAVIFLTEPQAQSQALAHLAAVRLSVRREHWIMQGADVRGYEGQVEILKNRLGQAGQVVSIRIAFNGTVRGDGL